MYNKTLKDKLKPIVIYGIAAAYSLGINGCATQKAIGHADSTNILKTSKLFLDCRDSGYLSEKGVERAQNIIDTGNNNQITNLYKELSEIKTLSKKENATTEKSERVFVRKDFGKSGLEKTAGADTTQTAQTDSLLVQACQNTLDEKEKTWASTADKGDTTYVMNPEKAKQLEYTNNGNGYFTTFATGKETKTILTHKPKKVKEIHWYDTGIFANNWVRGIAGVVGVGLISYGVSELNQPKSDKGKQDTPQNDYDLPEPPANVGVGGGRTDEGSEIGGVRGGRSDDNSEIGGNR